MSYNSYSLLSSDIGRVRELLKNANMQRNSSLGPK